MLNSNSSSHNKTKFNYSNCRIVWDWIIQVSLWFTISLFIYSFKQQQESTVNEIDTLKPLTTGLLVFIYIVYLVNNLLFSRIFRFLYTLSNQKPLHKVISAIVNKAPKVSFTFDFYHYANGRVHSNYTDESSLSTDPSSKVITHSETLDFKIYSYRDISGVLCLMNNKKYKQCKKRFVSLKLDFEFNFADAITMYDYIKQKNDYCNENKWRDEHLDFTEMRSIPDTFHEKLIKIDNDVPMYFQWYVFVGFLLCGIVELYKLFMQFFIIRERYVIRKLISSRNVVDNCEYDKLKPKISVFGDVMDIDTKCKVITGVDKVEPNDEEIEAAKKYQQFIEAGKAILYQQEGNDVGNAGDDGVVKTENGNVDMIVNKSFSVRPTVYKEDDALVSILKIGSFNGDEPLLVDNTQ